MLRSLTLAFVILAAALFAPAASHAADSPNLIFILADDMGFNDLGCMGSADVRTPNIDRLATEGVKFTDFYSNAPVCTPTRCGFLTGRWQQRVGFEWALGYSAEQEVLANGKWQPHTDIHHGIGLPPETPTIAKMLKSAGYKTGIFGKWHLGADDASNPLHLGFDEYFGTLTGHTDYYKHQYYDGTKTLREGLKPVEVEGYLTDLINDRAAGFIRQHAKEKFFLYVPHQAVHAPWQVPDHPELLMVTKENMLQGSRAAYIAMLERLDKGVGMILDELQKAGIADNTLIVFSSDNGGERYASNEPLFHHKTTLWEGGIHVPCVMRWPARLPQGKTTPQMGITMDLAATFAAAAGAKPPAGHTFDGIDLTPHLAGEQPVNNDRTFCWRIDRSNRKQRAIRHGDWKYFDDGGTMDLLFNLREDLGERHNLTYARPEIVSDLKQRLTAWEQEIESSPRTFRVH